MADNTPTIQDMQKEPALTIGEIFANKTLIKPAIAAVVAIIAGLFNLTLGDGTVDNITTVIMFAAMVYAPIAANREQAQLATDQAKETRSAVYSPATTKRLVDRAARTSQPVPVMDGKRPPTT